jgi:HSP20 family protein
MVVHELILPGMDGKEIHISATGRGLTITGERKIASEGENVKYHRREREGGTFNRVLSLPDDIQIEKIEAGYEDAGMKTFAASRH